MITLEGATKTFARHFVRPLIPQFAYARLAYLWHAWIDRGGEQDWAALLGDPRLDPVLRDMLIAAEEIHHGGGTSNYWAALNLKNTRQLIENGFDCFKQGVALNYFTFVSKNNYQMAFFKKSLESKRFKRAMQHATESPKHREFSEEESTHYNQLTHLLWEYLLQEHSSNRLVFSLQEPEYGSPPVVSIGGRAVTQDLGNSLLDFISLDQAIRGLKEHARVMELGAGYGRTSFVMMSARPDLRYTIVDIPPALYVSQRYLSLCFPNKKVFRFRKAQSFSEIEEEFLSSDLAFLMPAQLKLLPGKIADLFMAIDCLHEMRRNQIRAYFEEMDRLAKSVYFSCRKVATVPYERIILSEKDYSGLPAWKEVYWRERKVHTDYFEAFFQT